MLTVGSLFSGIGGIELGLEKTGHFMTVWQVEIDPYAAKILEKYWPDAQRYSDIRSIKELLYVDLICGGFPCQDISNAGKRAGLAGNRSGLWSEFARIVRMVRPRYVLVENVSALRSRGLGRVLGNLAACGYDAEWDCIPASAVGAPHQRDRIFIVAYSNRERLAEWGQCNREPQARIEASQRSDAGGCSKAMANASIPGSEAQQNIQGGQPDPDRSGQDVADTEYGRLPLRWGITIASTEGSQRSGIFCHERKSIFEEERSILAHHHSQRREEQCFVFPENAAWSIAECPSWWSVEPDVGRVAHGIPSRVDRLRCLGNAVVPQVAEYIGTMIMNYDKTYNKSAKKACKYPSFPL